jgi:hypothetical protein
MSLPLWRDLAAILLIIELIVLVLPFLVLSYFALKGLLAVKRYVRQFMPKVGGVFLSVENATDRAARVVVAPVIAIYSYTAFGRSIVHSTLSTFKGRSG